MSVQVARKLFTTADYHKMIAAGVFDEGERVELLNGEVLEMSPIGPRHAACVKRLNALLSRLLGKEAIVSVQDPIQLNDKSEPQPDLALLKPRADFYAQAHPTPADVLVAIEVADTSADKDRALKIPSFARAGIAEAWLVDLFNDYIEIRTQPANGVYQETRVILRGQRITSKTFPKLKLKADAILG